MADGGTTTCEERSATCEERSATCEERSAEVQSWRCVNNDIDATLFFSEGLIRSIAHVKKLTPSGSRGQTGGAIFRRTNVNVTSKPIVDVRDDNVCHLTADDLLSSQKSSHGPDVFDSQKSKHAGHHERVDTSEPGRRAGTVLELMQIPVLFSTHCHSPPE